MLLPRKGMPRCYFLIFVLILTLTAERKHSSKPVNQEPGTNKKVRFKCDYGSTIIAALRGRGWQEVHGEDPNWDLFWCDAIGLKNVLDSRRLDPSQRVAHFRNHYELTRKNFLARNLKRYRKHNLRKGKRHEAELCNCMPTTFELPKEYLMFVEEYRKCPGGTWIVKPAGGAQGRGIFLFQKLKDLIEWRNNKETAKETSRKQQQQQQQAQSGGQQKNSATNVVSEPTHSDMYVVQRYIEKPYLIAGRKFDMRLYVLVSSFLPLKVWLAREGFARLSSSQFSLEVIGDKRIHVTNMAVQLHPPPEAGSSVCKWHIRKLREFLTARHGPEAIEDLMQRIAKIVMTSLQAVQSIIVQNRHCFELYGYDILLDSDLKPWLLEVNASPSMGATDANDFCLKYNLLQDVLNIVDLEGRLTGKERRVGGFDLLWDNGPVKSLCPGAVDCFKKVSKSFVSNENKRLNAYIGCLNDRDQQLQELERANLMKY